MRDSREETKECVQREETDATRIPGDNIVGSLEDQAKILSTLGNSPDSGTARSTYGRKLG